MSAFPGVYQVPQEKVFKSIGFLAFLLSHYQPRAFSPIIRIYSLIPGKRVTGEDQYLQIQGWYGCHEDNKIRARSEARPQGWLRLGVEALLTLWITRPSIQGMQDALYTPTNVNSLASCAIPSTKENKGLGGSVLSRSRAERFVKDHVDEHPLALFRFLFQSNVVNDDFTECSHNHAGHEWRIGQVSRVNGWKEYDGK